jgi:hypothetical protein
LVEEILILYFYAGLIPIVLFAIIWRKLGGWPEAWWRIRRKHYFLAHVFDASGEDNRYPILMSAIEHKSQAGFDLNGKRRLVDEDDMARDTGRPSLYYNYDDMRPIPIFRWEKGGKKWDPSLVGAAYENKSIEDMHRIGGRRMSQFQLIVLVLLVVIFLVAAAGVYFAYNDYCALTPARCGGSIPRIG